MGPSQSKQKKNIPRAGPVPVHSFPEPVQDVESTLEDPQSLPLEEGRDLTSISDNELVAICNAAPRIHSYFGQIIARISKSLVIKAGSEVFRREADIMKFALERLSLPVPKVHRVFTAQVPNTDIGSKKGSKKAVTFIVMDYIHGKTVKECWSSVDEATRKSIAKQVADMINKMQSVPLGGVLPPGPLHTTGNQRKWEGPWFTQVGAGPFPTLQEFEAWLNHKIDVCIKVEELPPDWPRFEFKEDGSDLVLTHQDIAPRNLIVDGEGKVWLVDWGCAAVLPRGFEQAVLREQSEGNAEFVDMVKAELENQGEDMLSQFRGIQYALSTGRCL